MNKIIDRLIDEARTYYPPTENSGEYWRFDEDKFAALIIKHCCYEIESVGISDYAKDVWDRGYESGIKQAVEIIKEYFGVDDE